ncbi:Conserved_hypothetical protein [Hexamita inflata]|uniref:Uncharacterized protein n=2 Tax=Hexamita inflata TaxID=28002 RepID=A0AA86P3A8_9EUKA|nr:Conserved hypothetical protein [Hexamita inflata]
MKPVTQSGTLIGDASDHTLLLRAGLAGCVFTDETGSLSQLAGSTFQEALAPQDNSPITALTSNSEFLYFSTTRSLFRVPNTKILEPLSVVKIIQLESQVTALEFYEDDLLIGFDNGQLSRMNVDTKEIKEVIKMEDAVVNIKFMNKELIIVGSMSQLCVYSYDFKNYQTIQQISQRGQQYCAEQFPEACFYKQYIASCVNNKVQLRLVTDLSNVCFDIEIPSATSVRQIKDKLIVLGDKFYVLDLQKELKIEHQFDFDGKIVRFDCSINSINKMFFFYIKINDDDLMKYICLLKTEYIVPDQKTLKISEQDIVKQIVENVTVKKPVQEVKEAPKPVKQEIKEEIKEKPKKPTMKAIEESSELQQIDYRKPKEEKKEEHHSIGFEESSEDEEKHYSIDIEESSNEEQAVQFDADQLTQKIINQLKVQKEQNFMKLNNTMILYNGQTVNAFRNFPERLQTIQQAQRSILRLNYYGMVSQQKTQNYVLNFQFNNSDFPPKQVANHLSHVDADVCAEAYCYLNEFQLLVMRPNSDQVWKATFSRFMKPMRCVLGDYQYCGVVFDNRTIIIYNCGNVVYQEVAQDYVNICAYKNLFLIIRQSSIEMFDAEALKIVYRTSGIQSCSYCEIMPSGITLLGNEQGVFMLNYTSPIDGYNLKLVQIHSFIEEELDKVAQIQDKIMKTIKGESSEVLIRKELEMLKPEYKYVLYSEFENNTLQFYYMTVQQTDQSLFSALDPILKQSFKQGVKPTTKIDFKQLFQNDIQQISQNYPLNVTPQLLLLSLPNIDQRKPSPPINQNIDEIDILERDLFLQQLVLNACTTFQPDAGQFAAFDAIAFTYATKCLQNGLKDRAQQTARLFRTKMSLERFRTMAGTLNDGQTADFCMNLFNQSYMTEEGNNVLDENIIGTNLTQLCCSALSLYNRRVEEAGFAYNSGNAKSKYLELQQKVMQNVDDYLKQIDVKMAKKQSPTQQLNMSQMSQMQQSQAPLAMSRFQEEEQNLSAPKPDGNKKFLQMLKPGLLKADEKKPEVAKVADPGMSPVRASSLGLSQLLGKK